MGKVGYTQGERTLGMIHARSLGPNVDDMDTCGSDDIKETVFPSTSPDQPFTGICQLPSVQASSPFQIPTLDLAVLTATEQAVVKTCKGMSERTSGKVQPMCILTRLVCTSTHNKYKHLYQTGSKPNTVQSVYSAE